MNSKCFSCGAWIEEEDVINIDNKNFCEDCYDEYKTDQFSKSITR